MHGCDCPVRCQYYQPCKQSTGRFHSEVNQFVGRAAVSEPNAQSTQRFDSDDNWEPGGIEHVGLVWKSVEWHRSDDKQCASQPGLPAAQQQLTLGFSVYERPNCHGVRFLVMPLPNRLLIAHFYHALVRHEQEFGRVIQRTNWLAFRLGQRDDEPSAATTIWKPLDGNDSKSRLFAGKTDVRIA